MKNTNKIKFILANNLWLVALFTHTYLTCLVHYKNGIIKFNGDFNVEILIKVMFFIFFMSNLFTLIYVKVKKNDELIIYHVIDIAGGFFIFYLVIIALFLVYSLIHIFFNFESYSLIKTVRIIMIPLYIPVVMSRMYFSNF
jgi:hypothetical protein